MKKLLLFIIISIVTLSAPNPSNNQNSDKSVVELQIQIKELEQKINKQNKEYLNLKKEVEERIGLTYNIDQIYSTSKSHYEDSIKRVEELYSKSFENYNITIIAFLTGFGIIVTLAVGLLIFVKIDDSKKIKELREDLLHDMRDKKEEIEKNVDRILANSISYTNEIVNVKTSELDTLKLQVKEINGILAKELTKLEKKTVEELEKIRNEVDFKLKNINELSREIKNTLNAEKENIIKEIKKEISKDSKISDEIIISDCKESENKNEGTSEIVGVTKCKNLVRNNNYDEAILGYENIIKNSKDEEELYEAYKDLGYIYNKLNRYEESIINYKKALNCIGKQSINERINLYNRLSHVCYMSNRYDEALKYKEKAYELNPDISDEHFLFDLSYLYNKQNEKEKAIKILEQIKLKNSRKDLSYKVNYKIANIYSKFNNYEEAIEMYNALSDETKGIYTHDLPKLYYDLGFNYYKLNKTKEALENFEKIDKNSDYYQLCQSYIKMLKKKAD